MAKKKKKEQKKYLENKALYIRIHLHWTDMSGVIRQAALTSHPVSSVIAPREIETLDLKL